MNTAVSSPFPLLTLPTRLENNRQLDFLVEPQGLLPPQLSFANFYSLLLGGDPKLAPDPALVAPTESVWVRPPVLFLPQALDRSISPPEVQKTALFGTETPSFDPLKMDLERRRCHLCWKVMNPKKPMSSLLNHAKRHNPLKQFLCTECHYSSSESAHVRNHMRQRHQVTDRPPLDTRNPLMQQAWIQLTRRCFPAMAGELQQFRFKNFKRRRLNPIQNKKRNYSDIADDDEDEVVSVD